jgi:hypothetical protein
MAARGAASDQDPAYPLTSAGQEPAASLAYKLTKPKKNEL